MTHGGQRREPQAGFSTTGGFLRTGESGKQQDQESRYGLVLPQNLRPFLDGAGDLLHICYCSVGPKYLTCEKNGNNERQNAPAEKKVDPLRSCHISSKVKFSSRITKRLSGQGDPKKTL